MAGFFSKSFPPSTATLAALLLVTASFHHTSAQFLSDSQVSNVRNRLSESAKQSWELGTRAQALLELDAPVYSVFTDRDLPPPASVPSNTSSGIAPVFSIAKDTVSNRATSNGGSTSGPLPLIKEGSAADPASIGIAVLLANWTSQSGQDYAGAAQGQLDYLLNVAPKTSDGAISHRSDQVQLWSDFIYMVPPFLAYYGVLSQNQSLVEQAHNQIKLYRDTLRDSNANNLWKHVVLGSSGVDDGHWSTGNAWAAAGMARVLATIIHSPYDGSMKKQKGNLGDWIKEIHAGMYDKVDDTHIFKNYVDQNDTFYDAASTALLAASVYRMSVLTDDHSHVPSAELARQALGSTNSSGQVHFTSDGWLRPVVDPHSTGSQGSQSPEAQAFALELQAAYTDWVNAGSEGKNEAMRTAGAGLFGLVWIVVLTLMAVL